MKEVKVGFGLVYDHDIDKILLVKNKKSSLWSLPGGMVEEDEFFDDAVVREVLEETGLHIKIKKMVCCNEVKFLENHEHTIFVTFLCDIVGGEICIHYPNEIEDTKWFNIEAANIILPYYNNRLHDMINGRMHYKKKILN